MKKRAITMLIAATLVVSTMATFTGCGSKDNKASTSTTTTEESSSSTEEKKPKFEGKKIYNISNGKVKTLNPHIYTSRQESDMFSDYSSGLLRVIVNEAADNYEFVPDLAEALPTKSEDGLTWTFKIRDGIKWSDGTPIDVETFMYSYKMLLDPKLANYRATGFFDDFTVKNAEEYFNGKCKWEDVGIKSPDKNTIEFHLTYAVPDSDFLGAFEGGGPLGPIHPGLYEKNMNSDKTETKYGTSLDTIASCGPYKLVEWSKDQAYKLVKNPDSPVAKYYTPDEINVRVIEDSGARMQLFEQGSLDACGITSANFEKYSEDPRVKHVISAPINELTINTESKEKPILANKDFRKALYYCIDREKIANDILKGQIPAPYHVPSISVVDSKGTLYKDTEVAKKVREGKDRDPKVAKEYFEKAYAANGNKHISVEFQYFDSDEDTKTLAESIKNDVETTLGADKVTIELKATPFQVLYDNVHQKNYQLSMATWSGSELNPWSKMLVYTSKFPQKSDTFKNAEFDKLYQRTMKGDLIFKEKERIEALAKMEEILYEEVPYIPLTQHGGIAAYSDKIVVKAKKQIPVVGFGIKQSDFIR